MVGIAISRALYIVMTMISPIHPVIDVDEYFGGFHKLESSYNDLFAQLQNLRKIGKSIPRLYIIWYVDWTIHFTK